jgi:hypothetical protein
MIVALPDTREGRIDAIDLVSVRMEFVEAHLQVCQQEYDDASAHADAQACDLYKGQGGIANEVAKGDYKREFVHCL